MDYIIMILLTILIIGVFVTLLIDLYFDKKQATTTSIKKEISEERLRILLSDDNIVDKVNTIIDKLIVDAANMYMILNVNHTEDYYINAKEAETMRLYIYGTIKNNMTDSMKELISLIYDISTDKKLEDLLLFRIKIYMISIVVKNHRPS